MFEQDHPFALAYRMVEEGKLDPWNVDIVELANVYLEEIKKMEVLDMRIPARAVLAATFLLKKKVEVLFPEIKKPREKKKNYTLEEIVQEFEEERKEIEVSMPEIITKRERKTTVKRNTSDRQKKSVNLPMHVSKFEDVLEEINRLISEGLKKFSVFELFFGKNLAPYLMALMILYSEGKVNLYQEEPYGDLVVEVLSDE
ncbi:MAG: segregation/condensation protein A [Hydrogenobacter sp.]|uniref:segregation/condensation protein A n=1 Tax=Hydrogenobacter thermophilus TaxID=940 RepID=UPI0030FAF3D9